MRCLLVCLVALVRLGCIHAPESVLVDRGTALEHHASGSYSDVERKLARAFLERIERGEVGTPTQEERKLW